MLTNQIKTCFINNDRMELVIRRSSFTSFFFSFYFQELIIPNKQYKHIAYKQAAKCDGSLTKLPRR